MLTDDAINEIAREARTLPAAEVGRHVFPLIRHIAELGDRDCQNCRHWVRIHGGHEGECTRPMGDNPPVRLRVIMQPDGLAQSYPALVTAFDWSCRSWEERPAEGNAAQASQ